jgi:tryptophanyl-tRNA synthetase
VLQIQHSHNIVNWWNKAIAVGLQYNYNILFIATQYKIIAIIFYIINYITKVKDLV